MLNKISDFFKKKYIFFILLVDLYASLSRFFWGYPDPDQRFLIRIRIRPNDTDPTRSETLKHRKVQENWRDWLQDAGRLDKEWPRYNLKKHTYNHSSLNMSSLSMSSSSVRGSRSGLKWGYEKVIVVVMEVI